ncbi:MAG: hypothetical protein M3Q76_10210, partial [Acidobacteriota bacterium]|nr:hypothetical protein [Acidobacteriota bacterium]
TAPPGAGRTIDPTIVPTKIASSRHDDAVIPDGGGISMIAKADASTTAHLMSVLRRLAATLPSLDDIFIEGSNASGMLGYGVENGSVDVPESDLLKTADTSRREPASFVTGDHIQYLAD